MDFRKIRMFKGKKGISDEVFFNMFELVLAGIVIFSLYNFINDVSKQTIFEKNYLARDMALLINTLYTAPGDVSYTYNENAAKSKFIYGFSPNKVEVYEKEEALQQNHPFYLFAENKDIALTYTSIETDLIPVRIPFKDAYRVVEEGLVKMNIVKSNNQIIISKGSLSEESVRAGASD
ncbi:hypothetical protein HYX06_05790 [Candidatus Woesearchaeota archaeon]|nr:hypothetical protein [Candidatus Woesearchaeota archaeon]